MEDRKHGTPFDEEKINITANPLYCYIATSVRQVYMLIFYEVNINIKGKS